MNDTHQEINCIKPDVLWSQFNNKLELKITCGSLKKPPEFCLNQTSLTFFAVNSLDQQFDFHIDFFSEILDKQYEMKIDHDVVVIRFEKGRNEWWPRLTKSPENDFPWLKINLENTKDPKMKKLLNKNMNKTMKTYLILYNIHQSLGFMYTFQQFLQATLFGTADISKSYNLLAYFQLVMALDVFHSLFGFGGNLHFAYLQVSGRIIILSLAYFGQLIHHPISITMFMAWSLVESIRYPYYLSQILKVRSKTLIWLRYTIWMILYPLGYACEIFVMLETARKCNFSIQTAPFGLPMHAGTVIRIFFIVITLPGFISLLLYMFSSRSKKITGKPSKIHYFK